MIRLERERAHRNLCTELASGPANAKLRELRRGAFVDPVLGGKRCTNSDGVKSS